MRYRHDTVVATALSIVSSTRGLCVLVISDVIVRLDFSNNNLINKIQEEIMSVANGEKTRKKACCIHVKRRG